MVYWKVDPLPNLHVKKKVGELVKNIYQKENGINKLSLFTHDLPCWSSMPFCRLRSSMSV